MIVFQRYRKPCNDFRLLNYLQNIHNYVSLCAWCINIDYRSKTYRFHGVQKKIDFLVLHHTVTVYNQRPRTRNVYGRRKKYAVPN